MSKWLATTALCAALAAQASAQPFNVRAWYAEGQVFVIWQFPAPPAVATDTVEIYSSVAAQVTTANMTLTGRMFFPEYTGARLQALQPNARLLVPTPAGGTYRLAVDEGVFAYTPRAAGILFFAVVDTGANAVNAANSTATAFNYDPINQPIRPQPQFNGSTPGGNPYTAYVIWGEGRDDYDNARPDIPVLGDANKNGVPHVFTITGPVGGPPTGPMSCLFAIHGGGGEYQLFRPGIPARANMSLELDDGIVVSPDDSLYANVEGVLGRSNTSWFGYTPEFDPFDAGPRTNPADTAIVVNFTQRRVHYILDWLLRPNGRYVIDPLRVAMVGHSGGGRGTSHLTRLRPERFCAAVSYTPASNLSIDAAGRDNFLRGDWDQNLATNLTRSDIGTIHVTDVFTMTTRLSELRDFVLTRFFYGKRDEEDAAAWSLEQRAVLDSLNASRMGYMISWDEREHGVEKWNTEESDATDAHAGSWPDIGQWISPVRTYRAAGQYLVDTYWANQSYPGLFNADADPNTPDRQPDPGPGDPDLGDAYGTWGGYLDWETATIEDTPTRWECTLFQSALSATTIDNSPYASIVLDLAPRKTQAFLPPPGRGLRWTATDVATGVVLQFGSIVSESDGVTVVPGLIVPADPNRIRVAIFPCPADLDGDGNVDIADLTNLLGNFGATAGASFGQGDLDGDCDVDVADLARLLANFGSTCS